MFINRLSRFAAILHLTSTLRISTQIAWSIRNMTTRIPSPSIISAADFRQSLSTYDSLIESISSAKPAKANQKTLQQLDAFRYEEAVTEFQSENPKRSMNHDDVKLLVNWKLRHGKFRPTLMKLVSSNDEATVKDIIQHAMKQYWAERDVSEALKIITKLRGIGPATASLLLSVHDPEHVIFFSDEAFYWLCCDGKKAPIKYNMKEYTELSTAADSITRRLQVKATDVEKVAYVLIRQGGLNTTSTDGKDASLSETKPTESDSSRPSKAPAKRKVEPVSDNANQGHVRRSKRKKAL